MDCRRSIDGLSFYLIWAGSAAQAYLGQSGASPQFGGLNPSTFVRFAHLHVMVLTRHFADVITDGGLGFVRGDGGPLVVVSQTTSLVGDAVEDVTL